jgi:hypothetical protein
MIRLWCLQWPGRQKPPVTTNTQTIAGLLSDPEISLLQKIRIKKRNKTMATVSRVTMRIEDAGNNRSRVRLTYRVCFSNCEAMAGSTFVERVTLRGDDPVWDDHLITLRNSCIRAQNGCIDRELTRTVSNNVLDEDKDTIIFGWVIGNKDEVYARVRLEPFQPSGSSGDSNIVSAHFGPAG